MEGFKLIAIEPLEGCKPHIVKNLHIGEKYYFYQGYDINSDDHIEEINTATLQSNFFSKGRISVSVHAIVGRNGSGKSAVIELLMRVINNLSFIHNGAKLGDYGLVTIYGVCANLYFQIENSFYKIHLFKLKDKLHVEATIKELNIDAEEKNINETDFKGQIQPFFYTILNNYSLYAYNVNDYDCEKIDWTNDQDSSINIPDTDWINGICHKNDGYSTPIVVNSMRIKGNIDINTETHLTRSRLLSMLVDYDKSPSLSSFNLGDSVKRKISRVVIDVPNNENPHIPYVEITDKKDFKDKLKEFTSEIYFRELLWKAEFYISTFKKFSCRILNEWGIIFDIEKLRNDISFEEINGTPEYNYIVGKTMNIINKYSHIICPDMHIGFYTMDVFSNEQTEEFINENVTAQVSAIMMDCSHITLKIKQALCYIKYTKDTYSYYSANKDIDLNIVQFSEQISNMQSKWGADISDKLCFMPPSFVNFEIYYTDDKSKKQYPFKYLSSGEKQLTYFFTTILYHLRNLDSVFNSYEERAKYEYVNIILEEVELYFHPEMQRVMVDSLIKNIQDMNFSNLKGIDICLVTHSPIILSDIPKQNILFLENGKPKDVFENTFGANIHSLYKHSFFMDLSMGEFAKRKILDLSYELRDKKSLSKEQLSNIKKEIALIGEPLLRNQLMKLYIEKSNIEERITILEQEIEKLKSQEQQ